MVNPRRMTGEESANWLYRLAHPGTMMLEQDGRPMTGTDGERPHALVNESTVDAALDIIDQALEQAR